MAFQRGLPILLVIENTYATSRWFWGGGGQLAPFLTVVWFSNEREDPVAEFFNSVQWKEVLHNWAETIEAATLYRQVLKLITDVTTKTVRHYLSIRECTLLLEEE